MKDGNVSRHLGMLIEMQDGIRELHPLYVSRYPVTIVEDNCFRIYDVISGGSSYEPVRTEPCPFPIPKGIRAVFPLDSYNGKISAVVTGEVFDTKAGYVEILHEFVHCAQFNGCEIVLKGQLEIAQKYAILNDSMWEINHNFPYREPAFEDLYSINMEALAQLDYTRALVCRKQFKHVLDSADLEYLLWQEWKEGFARYLENRINNTLGLEENHHGRKVPYSREAFYESGSRWIGLVEGENPGAAADMGRLFHEMKKDIV